MVADRPSPLYRNAIGDECLYVESGTAPDRVHVRRARRGRRRLRHHPDLGDPPDRADRRRAGADARPSRRPGTSARRSATCRCAGSSSSTRRTASATCAGRPSRCCVDGTDVEVLRPAPRAAGPGTCTPTTRSTWSAGTAASTRGRSRSTTSSRSPAGCTSRRRCTRRSQGPNFVICSFVPAQGRLPPAGDPGAVQPPQRRLRRDAVLHRRQLRGPARLRHRAGLDLAAPVRLHARPAAGRGGAGDRRRTTSTSWPSWSTRSARSTSASRRWPARTPGTPGPGRPRRGLLALLAVH